MPVADGEKIVKTECEGIKRVGNQWKYWFPALFDGASFREAGWKSQDEHDIIKNSSFFSRLRLLYKMKSPCLLGFYRMSLNVKWQNSA